MKIRPIPCLLLLAAAALPLSAKPKVLAATMVPKDDAVIRALEAVIKGSRGREADLKTRILAIQKQIAFFKSQARDPKADLAEQLTKDQFDSYNLANGELHYLQNAVLVEEVRQRDLAIARDIYQASYFNATMMTEYIGSHGAVDDDYNAFCQGRAKSYGLGLPVGLLLNAQDFIVDQPPARK